MVHYTPDNVVPLSELAYAWRITDERWDRLPDAQLARILPMSSERGAQITQQGNAFRHGGPFYVNTKQYHVISECSAQVQETEQVKQWLSILPIETNELIYVSWGNDAALITSWTTFREVWDSLWYLEPVDVFDDTGAWAVLFGPEEFVVFVERGELSHIPHTSPLRPDTT